MVINQTSITGPKARPMLPVPRRCTKNSAAMMTSEIGTTAGPMPESTTSSPATAESTEMAGVITPSPKNSPAPTMPTIPSAARVESDFATRCASAISAIIPPSPLLSARITKVTYFRVTVMMSA